MIRAVVTDIEGTTSALSFVKDVLFPYARERLPDFVREHRDDAEVTALLDEVRALTGSELDIEDIIVLLRHWIDEDRKATPLKTLQGMIWEAGYAGGELRGHVYPDAVEALRAWHGAGLSLAVYSSGSVHAQRLLFGHTDYGDLTPLFSDYFDTRAGAKNEAGSYRQIVNQLAFPAGAVLFLSDVASELDAARAAGLHTGWLVRDGEPDSGAAHRQYRDFHAIDLEAVDA